MPLRYQLQLHTSRKYERSFASVSSSAGSLPRLTPSTPGCTYETAMSDYIRGALYSSFVNRNRTLLVPVPKVPHPRYAHGQR